MERTQSKKALKDDRDCTATLENIVFQKWPIRLYFVIMEASKNILKRPR
jgi:hypothetical protein